MFGVHHSLILILSSDIKRCTSINRHTAALETDPAKKAAGIRFGVGTGISRLTADAGSESALFYLLEEIPQMQDFVLIFPSPYLESFGVMNRVSSEEKNCNLDGRQPAGVCRT